VKYAKFSELPFEQVIRIVPEEQQEIFKTLRSGIETNGPWRLKLSNCLLISTDIAFEIWLIKP